nr:MAG TPA: hypothetical protein [Caudoviricetes sp.]DAU89803.1 MAG TPA: hypothetical protein [Caudoviricetes sp.]
MNNGFYFLTVCLDELTKITIIHKLVNVYHCLVSPK